MTAYVCYAGVSKLLSNRAVCKKAEAAVKASRLVVSGQLLQMLSNSQRPRSAASSSGIDSTKKGPLSWKFHDISLKGLSGSGTGKPKTQPADDVSKLQTETGVGMLDRVADNERLEDETAKLASTEPGETLTVNATATFCPKITNIVSLEEMQ